MTRLKNIADITDIQQAANKRLPRMFSSYIERGAFQELTQQENSDAFHRLKLRQSAFRDCAERSQQTTILGQTFDAPFGYGPTGLAGIFWPEGELVAAQTMAALKIPYIMSMMSICSLESVRAAVTHPFWFQLYFMKDRGFISALVDRAKEAGCPALFVNADLPITGVRYQDIRDGLSIPPKLKVRNCLDIMRRQRWLWGYLFSKNKTFGNLAGYIPASSGNMKVITQFMNSQYDQSVTWRDIEWLREKWPGKLIIKGILDADAARNAINCGADGVVVSNHGGRQLDGVLTSIDALPAIVDEVAGEIEVLLDSGINSGQNIARALALGANATLVGRPFLYGLAAFGGAGLKKVYQILQTELDIVMVLTGVKTIDEIDKGIIAKQIV